MRTSLSPPLPAAERAISLEELATALHVSERVLRSDLHDGRLSGVKVGNSWRFTRSDCEQYLGIRRATDILGPRPFHPETTGIPAELIA